MKLIARSNEPRPAPLGRPEAGRSGTHRAHSRGQVVVIFAGAAFVLFALMALVIDVSWYWANTLKVQRAADAAAMAGAVWLPGNFLTGQTYAYNEATKNGYSNPGGGCVAGSVCVTPTQDTTDPRQLDVKVSAPVGTFFMRLIGINSITATRTAKAVYLQPVPMGSPLNYYGISCMVPVNPSATWPKPACASAGNSNGPSGIVDAAGGVQLSSQGFWGVLFERGGDARNGDAFSPLLVSNGGPWVSNDPALNAQGNFDPAGYNYTVEVPAAGGTVYLFDPEFCEVGTSGNGQSGVGDQYTGAAPGASSPGTVTTYYNLYNTSGTPFTVTDDTLVQQQIYTDAVQTDQSKNAGGQYVWGQPVARAGARDCSGDAGHNRWVTLAAGLPAGTYRLQATTTNVDTNQPSGGTVPFASQPSTSTGAANRFGIEVTGPAAGSATPRVYGAGRMGAYNNLPAGTQLFYLAQIDVQSGAGKTAVISLYDPGDVNGGAWLRILSPDGNAYNRATFNYTSISKATGAAGPSGTAKTCIQTNSGAHSNTPPAGCPNASGGGNNFDAYWLTISVSIPAGYGTVVPATGGTVGLTPSGEPGAGWWKIEYTVNGGNDTTSWMVNIRGNPVHLVAP